jgi:FAD/FMN-containing dehydrogenase
MGLEVVVPPGDLIRLGGAFRKDVSGYDLKRLIVGSEGTLALITAAWLRLMPAPEAAHPVVAFFASTESGCAGLEAVLGNGVTAAALDYLDAGALDHASGSYPGDVPNEARFMLLAEADGSTAEAARVRNELLEVLAEEAITVETPEPKALWRWRDGVSIAVAAALGGKVSEDIEVPVDRLADVIRETVEIGRRHGLEALSWGHAGGGNVHATFLVSRDDGGNLAVAEEAASDLFKLALALGGSISGEHGLGSAKRRHAGWPPRIEALHAEVKTAFDPKGLLNPGKKL